MADLKVIDAEQLDSDLTIVADAIRSKSGTAEKLDFPHGMKQSIESISSGGGVSGDNPLDYATNISNAFQNSYSDTIHEMDVSFGNKTVPNNNVIMFIERAFNNAKNIKSIKVSCGYDLNNVSWHYGFGCDVGEYILTKIDISGIVKNKPNSINGFVLRRISLVEIIGAIDLSVCTVTLNAFLSCDSLEEVRFVQNTIKVSIAFTQSKFLSDESIQSIIDGLATVETTQTLTLHADVKAKLTETQLAKITGKNWTLA